MYEIIMPNKIFNGHNLENSIIRRPGARMKVQNKFQQNQAFSVLG